MATKDISDVEVCRAYAASAAAGRAYDRVLPVDLLHQWTGQPLKVCYAAMERASDRDLVDYGTSLRTGWLTKKGAELLKST